jgi:hypothetical protein
MSLFGARRKIECVGGLNWKRIKMSNRLAPAVVLARYGYWDSFTRAAGKGSANRQSHLVSAPLMVSITRLFTATVVQPQRAPEPRSGKPAFLSVD